MQLNPMTPPTPNSSKTIFCFILFFSYSDSRCVSTQLPIQGLGHSDPPAVPGRASRAPASGRGIGFRPKVDLGLLPRLQHQLWSSQFQMKARSHGSKSEGGGGPKIFAKIPQGGSYFCDSMFYCSFTNK